MICDTNDHRFRNADNYIPDVKSDGQNLRCPRLPEASMRFHAVQDLKAPLNLVYLALVGWACVYSVEAYLHLGFELGGSLTFMGIIFGIYTLNRLTDTLEDFTNDVGRLLFFRHRRTFLCLGAFSLAASFAWLLWEGKLTWLHYLLISIGLGYSFHILPWFARGHLRWTRVKEMVFVKNVSVAFLWGASIFLVPINYAAAGNIKDPRVWLLAVGLIISCYNSTLFDDIVDEPGDRVAGIKTVPTLWGVERSIRTLLFMDAAWILLAVALALALRLDTGHVLFLVGLGLYPMTYLLPKWRSLHEVKRSGSGRWPVEMLAEGNLACFAVGMLLLGAR
jgi:4-hydroxybenzoate polyprenyltransferase